jgi:hypothetical protein
VEFALSTVFRAADMNVYWGAGGTIDSVIDVTHNVPIAFSPTLGPTWGVLTTANTAADGATGKQGSGAMSVNDLACVEPLRSQLDGVQLQYPCTGAAAVLSNTATLGSIVYYQNAQGNAATAPVRPIPGFLLYVGGTVTLFELPALPAAGTVWTVRSYSGAIAGGQGVGGGSTGAPYTFHQTTRPFTAVGAEAQVAFNVVNQSVAPTKSDLTAVHTVPDPYYVTNAFESSTDNKVIKFVNLPNDAIIRIYSSSGVLVQLLEHHSTTFGGDETWNVRNRNNQVVASGVYFYHIEAGDARRVGRYTVVNFAQ